MVTKIIKTPALFVDRVASMNSVKSSESLSYPNYCVQDKNSKWFLTTKYATLKLRPFCETHSNWCPQPGAHKICFDWLVL